MNHVMHSELAGIVGVFLQESSLTLESDVSCWNVTGRAGMLTNIFIQSIRNCIVLLDLKTKFIKHTRSHAMFILRFISFLIPWAGHHGIHFGVHCSLRKQGKELWA